MITPTPTYYLSGIVSGNTSTPTPTRTSTPTRTRAVSGVSPTPTHTSTPTRTRAVSGVSPTPTLTTIISGSGILFKSLGNTIINGNIKFLI